MAHGKKKEQTPPAPKQFSNSPFAALKGISVEPPPPPEPVKPVIKPKQDENLQADDIFRQAMAGVRPLGAENTGKSGKKQTGVSQQKTGVSLQKQPQQSPREQVVAKKAFLLEVDKLKLNIRFEENFPDDDELKPLSGNRLRQVKRGIVNLDRQLDLHGLTREEAIESLGRFIAAARRSSEKAVLVITGKGNRSGAGPVLQQAVAAWLRDQGREMIAEYAPAPAAMGGSGAFVVFLRPLDKTAKE